MSLAFDPSISVSLGDLIKLLVLVGSAFMFFGSMRSEIKMLSRDVRAQGGKIDKLQEVVTMQARQDERLNMHAQLIEDLRRGRGYVQRDVDGLYGPTGRVPLTK